MTSTNLRSQPLLQEINNLESSDNNQIHLQHVKSFAQKLQFDSLVHKYNKNTSMKKISCQSIIIMNHLRQQQNFKNKGSKLSEENLLDHLMFLQLFKILVCGSDYIMCHPCQYRLKEVLEQQNLECWIRQVKKKNKIFFSLIAQIVQSILNKLQSLQDLQATCQYKYEQIPANCLCQKYGLKLKPLFKDKLNVLTKKEKKKNMKKIKRIFQYFLKNTKNTSCQLCPGHQNQIIQLLINVNLQNIEKNMDLDDGKQICELYQKIQNIFLFFQKKCEFSCLNQIDITQNNQDVQNGQKSMTDDHPQSTKQIVFYPKQFKGNIHRYLFNFFTCCGVFTSCWDFPYFYKPESRIRTFIERKK